MAAGLGFKTFTTGEVLTAADTNGYLMQGVLVFASSAARAAAITSPQEGQYSYLKDTNSTEYYDGAAWIAAPIGDITGVTAGVGITGGGTSGTVTVTNDMATTITAAGDIVVGTGSGTYDNLPIGTTAQVLTADTTVSPYKVKWATPAAGGGKVLQVVSATTTTETSINTTTLTDTTITATITPTLNTSKILVLVSFSASVNKLAVEVYTGGKLLRGATTICDYGSGNMLGITADAPTIGFTRSKTQGSIVKLDDPATTSATTYKVQMRGADASSQITMQQGSSPSTITLLEIGA
jgi:hypothetical protein